MIYLDHNATTPIDPEVLEAMLPFLKGDYGNPNSLHRLGVRAREAVERAREQVAGLVGARPRDVVFTGCATEALNTVLRADVLIGPAGDGAKTRRRHVIISAVEHPAVLEPAADLERRGFEVTRVPVTSDGRLDVDAYHRSLSEETALVALMMANNETGVLFPIAACAEAARRVGATFLTDAVQAAGKVPVDIEALGVDALVLSSHKIHGPKGVAALVLRRRARCEPLVLGGGQERDRRGGTENVAGIVGFGEACRLAAHHLKASMPRVAALRDRFEARVTAAITGLRVNGAGAPRTPNTSSLVIGGIEGESALLLLDREGIGVSTGSACASGSMDPSHVLTAMGIELPLSLGALRFSLGRSTTEAEVDAAADALAKVVAELRDLSPFDPLAGPPPDALPPRGR